MVCQRITEALTQRSLYRENLLHTEAFTHTSFSTDSTEAFAQRKLLSTGAFTHRRLYTQKLVHTEAFTPRSFYTEKPLHTHRRFPTEKKTIPQSSFYTFQKIAILRKFLTFGHHIVQKGCIRRWTIILRERVAPDLVKSQFYTSFISRETVVPDVPKWI